MDQTLNGLPLQWPLRAANVPQRRKRNGFAIHGYTGANGGGKTMAAVFDSLAHLAAGRPVVSTCRILDPRTGEPHPLWVPFDDFRVLLELSYCCVILDEVTGVASSRESMGLPSAVLNRLMQLRKGDVDVKWTTPDWNRADVALRRVTQGLTTCVGLMPKEIETADDDGLSRSWRQRRLFVWRTYDARQFDEWSVAKERSTSKAHRLRPITRQVMWGPGSLTQECYDTYEHALSVGAVNDAGLCMDCGHKRRAKQCSCEKDRPVKDASEGMRRWRLVDAERRLSGGLDQQPANGPAGRHLIPETDETPAVLVEI